MKLIKRFFCFLIPVFTFISHQASAQIESGAYGYYLDAGRFSNLLRGGSARSAAIGNACTALGGDMGMITVNPAGLGVYRKSEIMVTPVIGIGGAKTNYLDKTTSGSRAYLAFNNFGIVFNGSKDDLDKSDWRGGSFSITFNRVNNFQNKYSFTGINEGRNMGDYFVEITNGISSSTLAVASSDQITDLPTLGYLAYITNDYPDGESYYTFFQGNPVKQDGIITTKGAQNEWNVAYGGNFKDKLYVGGSVSLTTIRRVEEMVFRETPGTMVNGEFVAKPDTIIDYTYSKSLRVTGTGVNFKFGLIYKASDFVRLGASVISPTFYSMKDSYNESLDVNFEPVLLPGSPVIIQNINLSTVPGSYTYNFRSPMKLNGGAAIFLGKKGFISADIEYIPYRMAQFNSKDLNFVFDADNETIKNIYKNSLNYRIGTELRSKSVRFRGGFAYMSDPTKGLDNVNRSVMQFSTGMGVHSADQYFDVTLLNTRYNSLYQPYTLQDGSQPTANVKNSGFALILSGGVYF